MLQIALCDDNADDLSNLAQFINSYKLSKNFSCEYVSFTNGFELLSALEKGKRFDIYCLDIIMPGFTGIDTAKEIRKFDKNAPILFFTSSPEFALEGYSVKAINYVLKPITKEKFFAIFDDVLEQISVKKDEDRIVVKSSVGVQKILISNLVFIEALGRSVLYHLLSGKIVKCAESFSSAEEKLFKYECFVKPHRSYLVNMQYIDTIDTNQMTLQTLAVIPIAQGKSKEIKQLYLSYQMKEE